MTNCCICLNINGIIHKFCNLIFSKPFNLDVFQVCVWLCAS